jgi:hypothetical protein
MDQFKNGMAGFLISNKIVLKLKWDLLNCNSLGLIFAVNCHI